MKKNILLILIILVLPSLSYACSCFAVGENFCTTVERDTSVDLIVRGTKVKDVHHGIEFKITEVYKGTPRANTITVWGDNGALCRYYTSNFEDGEELILALHDTDLAGNWIVADPNHPDLEKEEDYSLSGCGVYWLRVDNNNVSGYINKPDWEEQTMPYDEFIAEGCIEVRAPIRLYVYPNPANDLVNIDIWEIYIDNVRFSLYNAMGQQLPVEVEAVYTNLYRISVSQLPQGIYFLKTEITGFEPRTERIVIHR